MKPVKKAFALLLALLLVLSLSACSALGAAKTLRKMQKLDSYHVDCSVDMSLGIGMMDDTMDLDFTFAGDADVQRDPLTGAGKFSVDMMGDTKDSLFYLEKTDEALILYVSKDDGENWEKSTIDLSGNSSSGSGIGLDGLQQLAGFVKGFEETGKETINGSQATVYSGYISGEDLKAVMDEANVAEEIAKALGADPAELKLDEIGSIPLTVAVDDKSDLVVRATMDLSAVMESTLPFILQVALKSAAASEEAEGLEEVAALISMLDFSCNEFMITVQLSEFDEVGEVSIPEDVLSSAVETAVPASKG